MLHQGFPCYPPEALSGVEAESTGFSLPLRHRQEALDALEKMTTPDQFVSDAALRASFSEFNEALAYIELHAKELGWVLLQSDFMLDGGSQARSYAKFSASGLDRVSVVVWSGMIMMVPGGGAGASPAESWGKVSYRFDHLAPPEDLQAFPLYLAAPGTAAQAVTVQDETSLSYRITDVRSPVRHELTALPAVQGWTRHFSPLLEQNQALYSRGTQLAQGADAVSQVKLRLWSGAAGQALVGKYPEAVSRHEVVDAGCIILEGRLLRRPYRLDLDQHVFSVNGVVEQTFRVGPSMEEARHFTQQVKALKDGELRLEKEGGHVQMSSSHSEDEIQALLARLDEVMAGPETRTDKRRILTTDPGLKQFFRGGESADPLLDHWNGTK